MRQQRILRHAYLHFVWATRQRLPLLKVELEAKVYAYITKVCQDDGCELIAIGGMPDHLHLLVNFSNTLSFAEFVQHIKGGSSRLINGALDPDANFAWQKGYAVFSIRKGDITTTRNYILNQKAHHASGKLWPALEELPPDEDTEPVNP